MEIRYVPLDSIVVEDRQRQEFREEPLEELMRSIMRPHGLLHPLILQDDGKTLMTGERRLRALRELFAQGKEPLHLGQPIPRNHAPVLLSGTLSRITVKEAELTENTEREPLTWQELAIARAELARLREEQGYSKREVAAEILGITPDELTRRQQDEKLNRDAVTTLVNDSLLLAENLHRPEVAKAPTKNDAMKRLLASIEQEFRGELGRRVVQRNMTKHMLIEGSCHEQLQNLESGIVDVILTDPPYGIGADENFGDAATLEHVYTDDAESSNRIHEAIAVQGWRIAKAKAHLYCFCDPTRFETLKVIFQEAGWYVWRTPLVWIKTAGGSHAPNQKLGPQRCYEQILYAVKGDKSVNTVARDVIEHGGVRNKLHAAQKPVEVYVNLLNRSVIPGALILDPCCGSGTIFPAATRVHCTAIGMELDSTAANLARSRLEEV